MPRIHLFEFEDFEWFPTALRNYCTDFLRFLSNQSGMYKLVIHILERGLKQSGQQQIVDLASGGGGGILWINNALKKKFPDLKILLTDYYPNLQAFEYTRNRTSNIEYIETPIDARDVPKELRGLRTQLLSFHHFTPVDATKILQNAVDTNNAIFIAEAQERTIASLLPMLISPIMVLITTPFIRPFKLKRILFTYIIPIIPLVVWWDGIISLLRTYSIKEMQQLINDLDNKNDYDWEIGKARSGPAVILYLLGTEKTNK